MGRQDVTVQHFLCSELAVCNITDLEEHGLFHQSESIPFTLVRLRSICTGLNCLGVKYALKIPGDRRTRSPPAVVVNRAVHRSLA
jgi:hypothetical protein